METRLNLTNSFVFTCGLLTLLIEVQKGGSLPKNFHDTNLKKPLWKDSPL